MRQLIGVLTAVLIMLPFTATASEYEHELKVEKMDVQWRVDGDKIHFKLSAETTGWVAIGFDPEKAMQGANIVIGAVKKGKVRIEDHYGDRKRAHSPDEKLGGENHILDPKGDEADGITSISFTIPLDTGDKWDKPIDVANTYRIMLAYGSGRDSFRSGHKWRGVYDINFTSGENKKIK